MSNEGNRRYSPREVVEKVAALRLVRSDRELPVSQGAKEALRQGFESPNKYLVAVLYEHRNELLNGLPIALVEDLTDMLKNSSLIRRRNARALVYYMEGRIDAERDFSLRTYSININSGVLSPERAAVLSQVT